MFRFLTSKPLWVNILAGFVLLIVLLLLFLGSLDIITHHGKTMKIPAVVGQSISQARKTLESQGFEIQIQDSIYNDTVPPLQVMKQFPEADNLVKVNRTVYLTINRAVAPEIDMPNLLSMTFRNAEMVLRRYGLKLGDTVFRPDFARNSVLDQEFNGESIKPGTKIQQGSQITLVLGNGVGTEFIVPDLFGLTYRDARATLSQAGLQVGSVVPDADVKDTMGAFVYRQNPDRYDYNRQVNHIRQGQIIDIWLSALKRQFYRTKTIITDQIKVMQLITVTEVQERISKGEKLNLVDVREPSEHDEFNIGGELIPLGRIQAMDVDELESLKDQELILYCRSGNRSGQACQILEMMGFTNTKNLQGGMLAWQKQI